MDVIGMMVEVNQIKSARDLKAEAQSLKPTVHVGSGGVTPGIAAEVMRQLKAKEVVKVRLLAKPSADREAVARELAEKASARLIEVRGRTVVLSRDICAKKGSNSR